MLKLELSESDRVVVDEVVHRLGVLRPNVEVRVEGNWLIADLKNGQPEPPLVQLIHDQFLQCRLGAQTATLRSQLYARLLK